MLTCGSSCIVHTWKTQSLQPNGALTCKRFLCKLLQFATLEKPVKQTVLKTAVLIHDGAETNPHN